MRYAVVQRKLEPLKREQLAHAFTAIERLTHADAGVVSTHARGIIAEGLTWEDASGLVGGFTVQGIAVVAVPESELLPLPRRIRTRRVEPGDTGLVVNDPLGRPILHAWDDLLFVMVGAVRQARVKTTKMAMVSDHFVDWEYELLNRLTDEDELMMQLIFASEDRRYHLEAKEVIYNCLASRRTTDAQDNLRLLVTDIVKHACWACHNPSALAVAAAEPLPWIFPTLRSFECELRWMIWSALHNRVEG